MQVSVVKTVIALVFGPPLIVCLVALLFADAWLARIDEKEQPEGK